MGKIAKPQKSKKHKKIKSVNNPFGTGSKGGSRSEGLNQKPRTYDQEVPKRLRNLGFTIDGVRGGYVGKKSKNKFLRNPDDPAPYKEKFASNLSVASSKPKVSTASVNQNFKKDKDKKDKKRSKAKVSDEVYNDYVDNLKPVRPFVEPFNFKKKSGETQRQFNQRVDTQAKRALMKSKIDEHFDVSDEKKMQQKMLKLKKGMNEKKKQRLKDKKQKKIEAIKEKKNDKLQGFGALKDNVVAFGDVVHAPPTLSVRPKKAVILDDVDRPGKRMPELRAMMESQQQIQRAVGMSVKRRDLTPQQQRQADCKRNEAIEAYRSIKKKRKY